jgi:hypothetical protein
MRPRALENTIHGLFNDYLGRGSSSSFNATTCKKLTDCETVQGICQGNFLDSVTCSGSGVCVCVRAHFHLALDEALDASVNISRDSLRSTKRVMLLLLAEGFGSHCLVPLRMAANWIRSMLVAKCILSAISKQWSCLGIFIYLIIGNHLKGNTYRYLNFPSLHPQHVYATSTYACYQWKIPSSRTYFLRNLRGYVEASKTSTRIADDNFEVCLK